MAAAMILLGVLLFIIQSSSIVTPQTEKTSEMKLMQRANDALICLDRTDEDGSSELKRYVLGWNGGLPDKNTPPYTIPANEASAASLDRAVRSKLPADVAYNIELSYISERATDNMAGFNRDLRNITADAIIYHGMPGDNSAAASRLVSINEGDPASSFWNGAGPNPKVVEVRLICWYM